MHSRHGLASGVVTHADLRATGHSRDAAERAVRAGRWQRPARGLYVPHAAPLSDSELVAAARAYLGEEHVVTGFVVLRALGLRWLPDHPGIHALVASDNERPSSGVVRVTRTTRFHELETWTRHGSRFADAGRAVVDATRALDALRDARGVVLGAVADGWATPPELAEIVDAGQRNGSALVRRACRDAARGCASPPEGELVDALVGRGAPFYVNPEIWLRDRLVGQPDIWLVGTGTGGEVESKERHGDERGVENTYDRHERFAEPGIQLVHLSVGRIRRDAGEAADHLLGRAQTGPPPPQGLRIVPRGPLLT